MVLKQRAKEKEDTAPFENPLTKITRFLTVPQNVPSDQAEVVDTQSDLSDNTVAELLVYHRTIADRFQMLAGKMTKEDTITRFANRISLITWANNRRSRGEAVEFGKHLPHEEREPLETERLEAIPVIPVEPKKKKRLGLI